MVKIEVDKERLEKLIDYAGQECYYCPLYRLNRQCMANAGVLAEASCQEMLLDWVKGD